MSDRARNAGWVGVSEPSTQRRKMAEEHHADAVFNPLKEDVAAEVLKVTDGIGADVVFDCAGIQASNALAVKAVRPRGTVMDIALWGTEPAKIDMNVVLAKEITITGASYVYTPWHRVPHRRMVTIV